MAPPHEAEAESVVAEAIGSESLGRSSFPEDFLFGIGSSALQFEGAANEGGKGPSVWDHLTKHKPDEIEDLSTPDVTQDQYHRYEEDIEILKDLGVGAYRFSIAWPRIIPEGRGDVNQEGIDYYNKLINCLLENGITPFATLSHFDLPQALEDAYGGWLGRDIVDDFAEYCKVCFEAFGDRVKHWTTINEPHLFSNFTYHMGIFPPQHRSTTEPYLAGHNFLLSHAAAVKVYREKYQVEQGGKIGITLDAQWYEPLSSSTEDLETARVATEFELGWFLNPITFGDYPQVMRDKLNDILPTFTSEEFASLKGSIDFLGINHYSSVYVTKTSDSKPFMPLLGTHHHEVHATDHREGVAIGEKVNVFNIVPWGIEKLLKYVQCNYNDPVIYITENGISDPDVLKLENGVYKDHTRCVYYQGYLTHLRRAIRDGVKVKGYFAWALLDNWEFTKGYGFSFGLYFVDRENNLARHPKESALWYKKFLHQ